MFSTYVTNVMFGENIVEVKATLNSNVLKDINVSVNEDDYVVQIIKESTDKYDLAVYYPMTKYANLNKEIKRKMDEYIATFKQEIAGTPLENSSFKYMLNVEFNLYKYLDYVSYVFYSTIYTGGAHPNSHFYSVSYDKTKGKIITLDDLMLKNKSLLVDLSEYSYKTLLKNTSITNMGTTDMLKDGTKATKDNFKSFAFTANGLLIFFEAYQVAPYASGEFTVTAPYDEINLKM